MWSAVHFLFKYRQIILHTCAAIAVCEELLTVAWIWMVALLLEVMGAGSRGCGFVCLGAQQKGNQGPGLAAERAGWSFFAFYSHVVYVLGGMEWCLIPNVVIMWLWNFVPKLKLVFAILGEFCIDIQGKMVGDRKLEEKCLHIVIQTFCICSIFLCIFLFTSINQDAKKIKIF